VRTSVDDQRATATRRGVLRAGAATAAAAALGAALTGCDLSGGPETPPAPDPLAPLLAGALELVNRYDSAMAAHPELAARLAPVRANHLEHATALARLTGAPSPLASGTPSPAPTPTGRPVDAKRTLAALRAAEQTAQRAAVQACLAAPAARAALVGSIAAARATHPEVLR
jgi:hypothetical protein